MKRIAIMCGLSLFLSLPAMVLAQENHSAIGLNHGEVGAFADYFRFAPGTSTANYVGTGGRLSLNFSPNLAVEGEMSYDFARDYTTVASNNTNGTITSTVVRSSLRPLTGLFGPRFQVGGGGPIRAFVTGKVGFVNFSTANSNTVAGSQFSNAVNGVGGNTTHFAMYPGGGLEGFFGPIGLRLEAGDEVYLNNGVYNNLKVTFGPEIRW
jgi:hypothetical protein